MSYTVGDLMFEVEEVVITLPREDWLAIATHLEILQGHQGRPIDSWQAGIIQKRILGQLLPMPEAEDGDE